jgi:hypothetical protein
MLFMSLDFIALRRREHVVCTQPQEAGLCPLGRLGLDALATLGLHRILKLAIWAS